MIVSPIVRRVAAVVALVAPVGLAVAQSGSATTGSTTTGATTAGSATTGSATAGSGAAAPAGSGSGAGSAMAGGSGAMANRLGLEGYCPVALVVARQWVKGLPEHEVVFDGVAYRFPNAETAQMFRNAPTRFAPVLGGDDVVEFARTGRRVPGALQTAGGDSLGARQLDRHYFFANLANKRAFMANARTYADADLAAGGACVVCRVDMKVAMPGDPKFEAVHQGMRFQFAGPDQRARFLANPKAYLAATPGGSGSADRTPPVGRAPAGSPTGGSGSAGGS